MKFKPLSEDEVTITVEYLPENSQPGDNFSEQEDIDYVLRQIAEGNEAAWFVAKVTASWENFHASAYLGGNSYPSFEEFKKDDYFSDLKAEAMKDLNDMLEDAALKLQSRFVSEG